jgi:hypothetical protein
MGNVIDGAFGACGACGTEDGSTDAATGNIDLRDGNADGIISAMKARCSSVDAAQFIAKHPHGASAAARSNRLRLGISFGAPASGLFRSDAQAAPDDRSLQERYSAHCRLFGP